MIGLQFLPGQWLVVCANVDGDSEIYLLRPDGSALRQLTHNHIPDDLGRWSADGTRVLFQSERSGTTTQHSVKLDRGDVRPESLDSVVSRTPDGTTLLFESTRGCLVASGTDPSWSRDGSLILFKTWDDTTQTLWISAVSPAGTGVRRLAQGMHPSWSPDGSRIMYMQDRDDGGADVWIMNRDAANAHCLTCRAPFR